MFTLQTGRKPNDKDGSLATWHSRLKFGNLNVKVDFAFEKASLSLSAVYCEIIISPDRQVGAMLMAQSKQEPLGPAEYCTIPKYHV